MLLNSQRIKDNGILVLDDVRGLPLGDEPFTSPDYVICIGRRGKMQMTYDGMPDFTSKQTVAVVFPNHTLKTVSKTDDYLATLVVVDASMLDDPLLRTISQMRYRYEPHPWVELNRHEYGVIMHLVGVMRETAGIDIPDKRLLLTHQLGYFMRLLSYYRSVKLNEAPEYKRIATLFQNNLAQYYHHHREVGFYAEKACLSPKYFSTVIKNETGHTAAWWIRTHVVAEAKTLLQLRRDLSIQSVSDRMGFADQASFSRYFKRETGLNPTEYRNAT